MLLVLPIAAHARRSAPVATSLSGTVSVLHLDGFGTGPSRDRYRLATPDGVVEIAPGAQSGELLAGAHVELRGHLLASGALSLVGVTPVTSARVPRAATPAPRLRTAAILLVQAAGRPLATSAAEVEAAMFTAPTSVNAFYRAQSGGALGFSGAVLGPWTVQAPPAGACPDVAWMSAARALAAQNAIDLAPYDHVVVVFPADPACAYTAAASVGPAAGSKQGEVFVNGTFSTRIVAHEIGHNLGAWHAAALVCKNAAGASVPVVEPIGACSDPGTDQAAQYGDPFDVMGSAPELRELDAVHRRQVGVLPTDATRVVGQPGDYAIGPLELALGLRVLEIPFGGGRSYTVELRRPLGFDGFSPSDPAVNGVLIHRDAWSDTSLHTLLVNANAATSADPRQSALRVGSTFTDAAHGIAITLVSLEPSGAVVRISVPGEPNPPAAPRSLSAAVVSPDTVELAWPASVDDTGIAEYRIERDGEQVATVSALESYTDNPAPLGRVYAFDEAGLAGGHSYRYRVVAVDPAGNVGPPSPDAVAAVPDSERPTPPRSLTVRRLADGRVRLAWSGATDDVGVVRYLVRCGARAIGESRARSYLYRPAQAARAARYSVMAIDGAGNPSELSPTVRLASAPIVVRGRARLRA